MVVAPKEVKVLVGQGTICRVIRVRMEAGTFLRNMKGS